MFKSLQYIMLTVSMVTVSLLGGKNIGMTREIDNRREGIIYTVEDEPFYTDGFWVEEDETVYLLKTYESAVLELKKNGTRVIPLSASILPADVVSDGNNLYVFDDILSELQVYTKQGELMVRSKIDLKDDYVKCLIKTEDGVGAVTYSGRIIMVDPESGKQTIGEECVWPAVDPAGYDYAEYAGMDDRGNQYSMHTTLWKDCSVISGEITLRAVSAEGVFLGGYVLPVEEYRYLPANYFQVLSNGNMYLLVPTENGTEIRKIILTDTLVSNIDSIAEATDLLEGEYAAEARSRKKFGTACTDKIEITREEAMERARAMAGYEWTLNKTHTDTSKSEKGVALPREIEAIRKANESKEEWSETLVGIPYCWGGFNSLDSGTKKWTFKNALLRNYVAGNITSEGHRKDMTAGLDCSGFVSAALGFKEKQGTKGLADLGSKVSDVRKLEMMDILVYPGEHVIFFMGWINGTTMLVGESAIREGKVIIHPKTVNELVVNGKYQMRSPW